MGQEDIKETRVGQALQGTRVQRASPGPKEIVDLLDLLGHRGTLVLGSQVKRGTRVAREGQDLLGLWGLDSLAYQVLQG